MTRGGERVALASIWVAALALIVFLPGAFNRWFLPKELVFLGAACVGSLALSAGRVPRLIWGWIGAGALVLLVAALASDAPIAAVFGRWPRYEGLVSLPVMVLAVWWGARLLGPRADPRRDAHWTGALSVAAIAIASVAALESFGLSPIPTDLARAGSLLGNATDQGIIGAALAAVLLPAVLDRAGRTGAWVPAAGTIGAVLATVLSGSRAGMLSLLVGVLVSLAAWLWVRHRAGDRAGVLRGVGIGGAVLGAFAALVFVLPDARNRVLGVSDYAAATVSDRWLIWGETLGIAAQKPWLGVGPSGYADAVAVAHGADWFASVDPGVTLDSPHSWPLQALMAGGVPLLLVALGLLGTIGVLGIRAILAPGLVRPAKGKARALAEREAELSDARRLRAIGAAGGLTAIAVGWLTHFTTPSTGILAGILIGVCCSVQPKRPAPPGVRSMPGGAVWQRVRLGGLLVWFVVFALVTAAEFPLSAALRAESAAEADGQFGLAQQLRPWDGDVASIAAQTFAARASRGAEGAGELGIQWAERALQRIPESLPTLVALGVAQRAEGQLQEAISTLRRAHDAQPRDPQISVQLAVTLGQFGSLDEARRVVAEAIAASSDDSHLRELQATFGRE